ncbi:hypothetical protein [Nocardia sp. NPDC047648]|uniref:hypothetical protein n=1 Tax=Nocardia sp. NPDC047648 TaxID=3155625 RepID=UPI0033FF3830
MVISHGVAEVSTSQRRNARHSPGRAPVREPVLVRDPRRIPVGSQQRDGELSCCAFTLARA